MDIWGMRGNFEDIIQEIHHKEALSCKVGFWYPIKRVLGGENGYPEYL